MLHRAISHARLMRESTDRVQAALKSSDALEQLVARRVLENADVWGLWEREHSNLMRRLADCGARAQVGELKQTTFRLLHGKALFQYLRRSSARGRHRHLVVAHFRPGRSYEAAIISEHGAYLRKACSFLCTSHLGSDVVRDPAFLDPMQRYEELYAEYFDLYCAGPRMMLAIWECGVAWCSICVPRGFAVSWFRCRNGGQLFERLRANRGSKSPWSGARIFMTWS